VQPSSQTTPPTPSVATENHDYIVPPLQPLATPVADLVEDPANARQHGPRNLKAIADSLRVYGQRKPVVVRQDTKVVIAGNGTLAAALTLGWSHLAAVFVNDDATTATGYAIADNRTGELAMWDYDALSRLFESLEPETYVDTGFSLEEVDAIVGKTDWFAATDGEPVELGDHPAANAGAIVVTVEDKAHVDRCKQLVDKALEGVDGVSVRVRA